MRFITSPTLYKASRAITTSATGVRSPLIIKRSPAYSRNMASLSSLGIESTDIKTAQGVTLTEQQQILVGSVMDLFAGRPSLKKLSLWKDDAVFEDNITNADGRKKYEPQWYGLTSVFSNIERLSHEVTDAGNPIQMNMKTRYTLKGFGKDTTIDSKIEIHYDESGKITKVADKWGGTLPDGSFATALRNLNAVTVPKMVSVPKTEEEDMARLNKNKE